MISPLPMLAHKVADYPNHRFPVLVQPKLDGVRCIQTNDGTYSRNGKPLHRPPCMEAIPARIISMLKKGWSLDGELYTHGMSFQALLSLVKRANHPEASRLEYHVYDMIPPPGSSDEAMPQSTRSKLLQGLLGPAADQDHPGIVCVQTNSCINQREVDAMHRVFTEDGYEGTMIRVLDGLYLQDSRSASLLKRKDFIDEEFTIVGITEGKGKNATTAIFECSKKGAKRTFTVTAPGDYGAKAKAWANRNILLGKEVTVRYQELTDEGIPRFPIAAAIRDIH